MPTGCTIGTVSDNKDTEGLARVRVEFPILGGGIASQWCRVVCPMAGPGRGMVILPEVGSEVVIGFSADGATPWVLGVLYNSADDKPQHGANADGKNNLRMFWSRGGHVVAFDDTEGAEQIRVGASSPGGSDVTSAPVFQVLDAAEQTLKARSGRDLHMVALETISIHCKDFVLQCSGAIEMVAGSTAVFHAGSTMTIDGGPASQFLGSQTAVNGGCALPPSTPLSVDGDH